MIKPFTQDDIFLDSVRTADPGDDHFALWWLGQSGYLIKWRGNHLLLDPYLSDSLTLKYAETDKPHIRMTERVIRPAALDFIDIVTSSHNHTDHLDGDTLIPLLSVNPEIQLVIPEANREFVCERLKCPVDFPIGLNDGKSEQVGDFKFHGVPAAHNQLDRDEKGQCKYMGYVIQFEQWTLYHSGDTLWFEGMEDLLKPYNIDLAILPINGNRPERRVAGNLNCEEATRLAQTIGARMVIPCHYHMFTFNTADPAEFKANAEALGQPAQVLRCGEPWNSQVMA